MNRPILQLYFFEFYDRLFSMTAATNPADWNNEYQMSNVEVMNSVFFKND